MGIRTVLLGLGSNVEPRKAYLQAGIQALTRDHDIVLEAVSALYRSDPVDAKGGEFLNAVARLRTRLSPGEVLNRAKAVERALGRTGSAHDARPLDLDLLYFGEVRCRGERLSLPHPRLRKRPFVRLPLLEVCDDLRDPETGRTIREEMAVYAEGDRRLVNWVQGPEWVLDAPGKGV